ncbi:hypothetical protein B0H11DRAFT_1751836 [Mycena galericulata]|nr:hypothetical protein B0H11DRAFT_1751836 [Mycena galericulata]
MVSKTETAAPSDTWYYPAELADDIKDVDLPDKVKAEVLACAWEYTRTVIPHYTNWERYLAFARLVAIATIAEFKGDIVDLMAGDNVLGYSLSGLLAVLFQGTSYHEDMGREYRATIFVGAEKSSNRRDGKLFSRYVNALVQSPAHWFRMRACDGGARWTIAAAWACNDVDDCHLSEQQFQILEEIAMMSYDAVAFYKHRAEGEVHNTFAYMDEDIRVKGFRTDKYCHIDSAWARQPNMLMAVNFVRFLAGPLHISMRRYRFVEEDLTIGKPETDHVIMQTRQNLGLWNRIEAQANKRFSEEGVQRYRDALVRRNELMFSGLAEMLETAGDGHCNTCSFRESYGAVGDYQFGGVALCNDCRAKWRHYHELLPQRARLAFPELHDEAVNSFDGKWRLCIL